MKSETPLDMWASRLVRQHVFPQGEHVVRRRIPRNFTTCTDDVSLSGSLMTGPYRGKHISD